MIRGRIKPDPHTQAKDTVVRQVKATANWHTHVKMRTKKEASRLSEREEKDEAELHGVGPIRIRQFHACTYDECQHTRVAQGGISMLVTVLGTFLLTLKLTFVYEDQERQAEEDHVPQLPKIKHDL